LQESAKVRHTSNPKQLEQPKIDLEEVMTFHNGEENELEDVTKNTKLKTIRPTINHPLELQCLTIKPKTPST
jgi:hypothetical protein